MCYHRGPWYILYTETYFFSIFIVKYVDYLVQDRGFTNVFSVKAFAFLLPVYGQYNLLGDYIVITMCCLSNVHRVTLWKHMLR